MEPPAHLIFLATRIIGLHFAVWYWSIFVQIFLVRSVRRFYFYERGVSVKTFMTLVPWRLGSTIWMIRTVIRRAVRIDTLLNSFVILLLHANKLCKTWLPVKGLNIEVLPNWQVLHVVCFRFRFLNLVFYSVMIDCVCLVVCCSSTMKTKPGSIRRSKCI